MSSPYVYDKAKYHYEEVEELGLPEEHAANHTVFFLRWLIENDLMSPLFAEQGGDILKRFRAGELGIHDVYEWWDSCLIEDMLSVEGNAFAMHYFNLESGPYLSDYSSTLQGDLPSELYIDYTEDNYRRLKEVVDRRFLEWKRPKRKWWPFGR